MKVLLGAALAIGFAGAAAAQAPGPAPRGIALPGDHAPMAGGGAGGPAGPPGPRPVDPPPAANPSIDLALKAAQAIAAACKQYPMSLAVVDSEGVAKLVWVPDNSNAWHGYSAVRKAYTAVTFRSDTSKVIKQAATDPAVMDRFKADPNLTRQSGGLVLMVGDKVVGAIGVSGAEPGGHDEECALVGRERIKNDLK